VYSEIADKYAQARVKLAQARKLDEAARRAAFNNHIRELRLTLTLAKAVLHGEKNKKALLMGERVTVLLKLLRDLQVEDTQ
jgi:hypothetical protein